MVILNFLASARGTFSVPGTMSEPRAQSKCASISALRSSEHSGAQQGHKSLRVMSATKETGREGDGNTEEEGGRLEGDVYSGIIFE